MKITFLGVSGALSAKYNSNMLIENGSNRMLFDCGEDVMHSLKSADRTPEELTDVYISHLHYDHMAGISWLGYYSYFIMKKSITLWIHESMVSDLWAMLRPAMEKLDGIVDMMSLDDYFDVRAFKDDEKCVVGSFSFTPTRQTHVETPHGNMYSYGVSLEHSTLEGKYWTYGNKDGKRVFISSDTKCLNIRPATHDYIFSDCDVMNLGGVHPNYNVLKKLNSAIREKVWLYHYTNIDDYEGQVRAMPDAVADGFAGFVKEGQIFEI